MAKTAQQVLNDIKASELQVTNLTQETIFTKSNGWATARTFLTGDIKDRTRKLVSSLQTLYKFSKEELTKDGLDSEFKRMTTAMKTFGDFVADTIETGGSSITKELLESIDEMITKMGGAVLSFIKNFISVKFENIENIDDYTNLPKTCVFIGALHQCIACKPEYANDPLTGTWLGSIYSVLESRVGELKNRGINVQIGTFPIFSV